MKAEQKIEQLLKAARNNFERLPELIAVFAEVCAQSRFDLNNLYGAKIQEACISWSKDHKAAEGYLQLCIGLTNYYNTQFGAVEEPIKKAMSILEESGPRDLFGLATWVYGANNRSLGQLDLAVKFLHRGGDIISEKGNLSIYKCFCYYQLSEINNFIKDFEAAERYCLLSRDIAERLNSLTGMFRAYNGLANLYLNTKRFEEAQLFLDKSLAIEGLSDSQKSRSKCDLGILYQKTGQLEAAEKVLTENYQERLALDLKDAASTSLLALATTQLALKKYEEALINLEAALIIINEYNSFSKKIDCHLLLSETYYALENWEKAAKAYKTYQELNKKESQRQLQNIYKIKNKQISDQKEVIESIFEEVQDSIRYAKRIQHAILPPQKLVETELPNAFVLYKPKDIVAGDFYWLERVQNKVLFAAADCTGHGVPGAMVSVVCNNSLNRSVREYGFTDPGKLLDQTRTLVVAEFEKSEEEVKDGMDIALCCLESNKLSYAGAHNPLWLIRNGELIEIKANKQPIGQFDQPEPYATHTLDLIKGDTFYIFSDGYADQFGGEKGKKFKSANFKKLLLSIQHEEMTTQKQLLDNAFENWKGELEQLDDVCVIGVRI